MAPKASKASKAPKKIVNAICLFCNHRHLKDRVCRTCSKKGIYCNTISYPYYFKQNLKQHLKQNSKPGEQIEVDSLHDEKAILVVDRFKKVVGYPQREASRGSKKAKQSKQPSQLSILLSAAKQALVWPSHRRK